MTKQDKINEVHAQILEAYQKMYKNQTIEQYYTFIAALLGKAFFPMGNLEEEELLYKNFLKKQKME